MPKVHHVLLLIESSRASGRSLLRGIADYARHHGRWAIHWEPGGLEKAWPRIRSLNADGVILRDTEAVDEVMAYGLPLVVVGHSRKKIPGVPNLVSDSSNTGRLGAEHLLHCGLKYFAFCGIAGMPWSEERGAAFQKRIADDGYEVDFYAPLPSVSGGWQDEQKHLAVWLGSLPKPVGLMACNDDRGQQVVETCKAIGLGVPDQVAVLGADNDELVCELSDPPMTSVAINFTRAGYESARMLDRLMRPRKVREACILAPATYVVTRQSTDILAVDDPAVGLALRFIRNHGTVPLGVAEVVKASGLSRRVLELRFRRVLGRSLLPEIRRVRVNQICRLLAETNQPISQVALALGFEGVEHFARYFRREMQMTPLAYRRKFAKW
jgi:LacI family transcriptional regulator